MLTNSRSQGKPYVQSSENYPPPLVATSNQITPKTGNPSTVTTVQATTMLPDPNPCVSEKVGQGASLPPVSTLTIVHSNSGSEKVINPQAVAEIHTAFNAGIMNLLTQAASNPTTHQPPPPQQQYPHQQNFQSYPHQPFQPYPGPQPRKDR